MHELKKIIGKYAKNKDVKITDETDLFDDLNYDSLSILQLIIEIEDTYGIEIDDVQGLTKYINLVYKIKKQLHFFEFYDQYLGITNRAYKTDKNIDLYLSEERNILINKQYCYYMIITNIHNRCIISCTDRMLDYVKKSDILSETCDYRAIMERTLDRNKYRLMTMYRLILDSNYKEVPEPSIDITIIYMPEEHRFRALIGEEIVGYCKISDIIHGYGNVVVYTREEYRNKGIAKKLLQALILQSRQENIELMYLVEELNYVSLRLAQSVGFSIVANELIVSNSL